MTAGLLRGGLVPGGVPGEHPRPPPLPLPLHPRHDLRHDLTLTLRQLRGEGPGNKISTGETRDGEVLLERLKLQRNPTLVI